MQHRVSIEQRYEGLRSTIEDDIRNEIDRMKTVTHTLLVDQRIRAVKVDEDIAMV